MTFKLPVSKEISQVKTSCYLHAQQYKFVGVKRKEKLKILYQKIEDDE